MQAHLERISDFLITGPGVWWRKTSEGFEFLDGTLEGEFYTLGPPLMHYRSHSLSDIDLYLLQQWERCCCL